MRCLHSGVQYGTAQSEIPEDNGMKNKELKRLSRAELLELLLVQTKETERLQKRLEKAEAELADRQLHIQKTGDLAHAVLEINGVMEAARAAAQQYLDNIVQMEKETKLKCEKMLSDARKEAAQIRKDAPKPAGSDNALLEEIYDLLGEENK